MKPSISVIGTVFIDYKGFAQQGYQAQGRNLGKVEVVPGGVARNVAVNMVHLNVDTWFVGTLNDDGAGETLKKKMLQSNINLEYLKFVSNGGTGVWLAILDHNGSLLGSISQMPDVDLMEREITPILSQAFSKTKGIALDIDLNESLVRKIIAEAKKAGSKVYALPGNFSVISKNYDLFKDIECFICNETEVELLIGKQDFTNLDKVLDNVQKFAREQSLKNFVVTLGEKGSLYVDEQGNTGFQEIYPTKVVDSTGAGDAFFSGTVAALLHKKSLGEAIKLGSKIASIVISCQESDCSELKKAADKKYDFDWFDS